MGLFGPSKAELKGDAETTAAITDADRRAAQDAEEVRRRVDEWRQGATSRCHCGRPAPPDLPCDVHLGWLQYETREVWLR